MNSNTKLVKTMAALGAFLTLMLVVMPNALAKNDNPGIIPPNANAYGMTYGEWSAKWWVWTYSMPVDHHPLYNTADCSAKQSDKVWFLGGTFSATTDHAGNVKGEFTRNCTVPTGTALFLPVLNSEASPLEGDPSDPLALRAQAKYYQDQATNLYAKVDEVDVKNLQSYRVQSPLSKYGPLPLNNVPCNIGYGQKCNDPNREDTNLAGQTSNFVGDGVYLMLAPLSAGTHKIEFGGEVPTFKFTLHGIYNITVAPGGKK